MADARLAGAEGREPLRVFVVEDNDALRRGIGLGLRETGHRVEEAASGDAAIARIGDLSLPAPHVVVTDLRLPGADGVKVLRAALAREPRTGVVVMTAYGSIETAVEAMRMGAYDFVQKPFDLARLERCVAQAGVRARGPSWVGGAAAVEPAVEVLADIVAESTAMRDAIDLARRVAPTRSTVLVTGETGTGKEIIAGLIHACSDRSQGSFVKVNCAALPETLLESELFGHERGAFTGADRQRIGRFEQATGGTLFLDEIGDMTSATQSKLLRVLQDQEFYRLGGTRALRTDARIVAATNQDLLRAKREGRFREDLYFRLDVIGIRLPPLRERPEDLVALCDHFLAYFADELGRPVVGYSEAARVRLGTHRWPGNVRELRNVIERAVLMCDGARIGIEDLCLAVPPDSPLESGLRIQIPPGGVALSQVERELVLAALEQTGYVQKEAARLLHVSRRKLNYMVQRLGVTHPSWRRNRRPPDA
jgi:DNA-binding NtrC family response regulator